MHLRKTMEVFERFLVWATHRCGFRHGHSEEVMTSQPPSFTSSTLRIKALSSSPCFIDLFRLMPSIQECLNKFWSDEVPFTTAIFFFGSNGYLEERTMCERRRCQESEQILEVHNAANLWRPQKTYPLFSFWRHFLGSFLFCVWIQSREIWCWYLVEVWAVHLSGKFWWFAAYASGLSVYVRGEILQGGNSDREEWWSGFCVFFV